ncbi:MAG: PQQ-binding-like beta-propeller repeat protein [Weeksellaceae bacterium]|nr:PQQ-binding-like beta-propeller repeat protein [Weeksellaceae bacterium]
MKSFLGFLVLFFVLVFHSFGQTFQFAQVTDTHVGGSTGLEDLERTIQDINANPRLDFVIFSGDITEFGSDEELMLAKNAMDKLNKAYYVIPGNHDSNWSESGANSFRTVFGSETFGFEHKGFLFLGTHSGPNMRMSPGQIPRENLVWMDQFLKEHASNRIPIISVNHYPQDSSLNNWFDAVDMLKSYNVQMAICGHGHNNKGYNWDGIPGVMSRSNLRAKDSVGAYNIIEIQSDKATFTLRFPGVKTEDQPWHTVDLRDHHFELQSTVYPRPDYSVNDLYTDKREVLWEYQDNSDIGSGIDFYKKSAILSNTQGEVYALNLKNGEKIWTFQTGGKIYSTPAVYKDLVVVGSSDHYIYGISAKNGLEKWKFKADKAVLGTPLIEKGVVFIGASDGKFRALEVKTGKLLWEFEGVKGYISSQALIEGNLIYFGSWGNDFYALNKNTGEKVWEWSNGSANRMFSPAACIPVYANGKIFIVAPDRYMTALDAQTGELQWRELKEGIRVRESMGLSADKKLVYVKTMDGELLGVSTLAPQMEITWKSTLQLPYEISPTAIKSNKKWIFVPSHSGLLSVIDAKTGSVSWQYKISNGMVNPISLIKNKILVSTMDGKVSFFEIK